jgi:hypothetical protein
VCRIINQAIDVGYEAPRKESSFKEELKKNAQVFAAFKSHRMGRDMASRLLDENGEVKSYQQFKQDVEGIVSHHVDQWLHTEYDTAIKRAHKAAEMRQFIDESDVFPNIKWLPSTALNPRESHMPFYNHVWPINDPFWEKHKPGDEWGCQCDWEATDEKVTDNSGLGEAAIKPSRGLNGNPARTGQLISDDHPYFPSDCNHCAFHSVQLSLFSNKKKDCYHCKYVLKPIEKAKRTQIVKPEELEKKKSEVTKQISKLPLPSPVVYTSSESKYGTFICSKSDIRQLVYHAPDMESIDISMQMYKHLSQLQFVRTEVPKHFRENKRARGLIEYTVYKLNVDNRTFIVKCEARANNQKETVAERPYSIYKQQK